MKIINFRLTIVLTLCLMLLGCNDDEGTSFPQTNCNDIARIDSFTYANASTSPYTITGVSLNEECLIISFTATGCDGISWMLSLADSGEIMESDPPQRSVKLFLINNEACLTEVSRSFSFDLSTLEIEGENEIIINIDGFSETVTYTY